MIRSEAAGGRSRRYRAEDVLRLKGRKERRRDPEAVVEGALRWGTPVMESAITLVTDGGLYYRGRDVVGLSVESTVEEVAALIWTGDLARAAELFPPEVPRLPPRIRAALGGIRPPTTCVPGPCPGPAPGSCASWRASSPARRPLVSPRRCGAVGARKRPGRGRS